MQSCEIDYGFYHADCIGPYVRTHHASCMNHGPLRASSCMVNPYVRILFLVCFLQAVCCGVMVLLGIAPIVRGWSSVRARDLNLFPSILAGY